MKRELSLWTPILMAPFVWLLSLSANFVLAPWVCLWQGKTALHVVSVTALIMTAAAGLFAWSLWRRAVRDSGGNSTGRATTMAIAGVFLSGLFFVVILAQSLPDFLLTGCE